MTAAQLVADGVSSAFALCRPPGHHAAHDLYGGYCFPEQCRAGRSDSARFEGASRVVLIDVDFHHGNGTQDIFYARDDVLFISIHGAPEEAFPHFMGYADETGIDAGDGYTLNLPLPRGTDWPAYAEALDAACRRTAPTMGRRRWWCRWASIRSRAIRSAFFKLGTGGLRTSGRQTRPPRLADGLCAGRRICGR
jgi:acetoin utilization deacetylase AcuC-like enzyme